MRKFDPSLCQPHLKRFLDDEYPPSAIFLEYIAGLEMVTLDNYTLQRLENAVAGIREIHKALVRHKDPKPRNIMVVKDSPNRIIWLDFDRAETYDEDSITSRQLELIEQEEQLVIELQECLVSVAVIEEYYTVVICRFRLIPFVRNPITQKGSLMKHTYSTAPEPPGTFMWQMPSYFLRFKRDIGNSVSQLHQGSALAKRVSPFCSYQVVVIRDQ